MQKPWPYPYTLYKNSSKMYYIKIFIIIDIFQLLDENIGQYISGLGYGKEFFAMTPKAKLSKKSMISIAL